MQKVEVTNVYRRTQEAKAKTVIHMGGAGSSKTYSLIQFFVLERLLISCKLPYELLIIRKTRSANKLSVCKDFIKFLRSINIYSDSNFNKTDLIYNFKNGNSVRFAGLEDQDKIKSTQWHDIWIEEANELYHSDYTFLKTRLFRGEKDKNKISRIWLSYNPVECWINDLNDLNVDIIHSTYKDNTFCNEDYIETLENLKNEDYSYYQIYTLGITAQIAGIIYKPYQIISEHPINFDEEIYGIDFGYNNPSVLLSLKIRDEKEVFLTELIYRTGMTNSDFINAVKNIVPKEKRSLNFYADSAEPDRIEEFYRAGFNIKPADKAVEDGIDFCKRFKFYSLIKNINLNKENKRYKYKEDKKGKILTDSPVKYDDHCMDAKRYAIYTHLKDKLNTFNKLKAMGSI
jgi:phage terminase large subunit